MVIWEKGNVGFCHLNPTYKIGDRTTRSAIALVDITFEFESFTKRVFPNRLSVDSQKQFLQVRHQGWSLSLDYIEIVFFRLGKPNRFFMPVGKKTMCAHAVFVVPNNKIRKSQICLMASVM